jgi:hypothetical protein
MTHSLIEMTADQFNARYPLRTNHLNPHACWSQGEGRGCLFETFGEEFDFVRRQPPRTVWTLIDGDGGEYLMSGFHLVNRLGYLVSTALAPEGVLIQVALEAQPQGASAHTPEPWEYRPYEDGKPITNGQIAIAYMDAYEPEDDDNGTWAQETDANARRLVAAINACAGISTEALEQGVVAELLSALTLFLGFNDQWLVTIDRRSDGEHDRVMRTARAAIAKATSDHSKGRAA